MDFRQDFGNISHIRVLPRFGMERNIAMLFITGCRALVTGLALTAGISATPVGVLPIDSPDVNCTVINPFDSELTGASATHLEELDSFAQDSGLVSGADRYPSRVT